MGLSNFHDIGNNALPAFQPQPQGIAIGSRSIDIDISGILPFRIRDAGVVFPLLAYDLRGRTDALFPRCRIDHKPLADIAFLLDLHGKERHSGICLREKHQAQGLIHDRRHCRVLHTAAGLHNVHFPQPHTQLEHWTGAL